MIYDGNTWLNLLLATHGWLVFIILGKSWFLHIINAVNEPILMVLIAQDMCLYHFIGHRDTRFIMSMNLRDNDYLNWSLASRTLNISGSCVIPAERYIVFNSIKSSTAESWLYLTTDPKRGQLGIIGNAPSSDRNGFALCCFALKTSHSDHREMKLLILKIGCLGQFGQVVWMPRSIWSARRARVLT